MPKAKENAKKNNPSPKKDKEKATKKQEEQVEASLGSINDLLKEELEKTKAELKELKDTNLRQLAEVENTRKRLQKEREDLTKYAVSRLVEDFLPPLDQMEKALDCADGMSDEVKNWAIGFQMILSQFKDVFSGHNIIAYSALGKPFDPHMHEAVEVLETEDEPEWKVLEEFACGYKMGDYIIRPAKVKVAKKPKSEPEEKASEEEKN